MRNRELVEFITPDPKGRQMPSLLIEVIREHAPDRRQVTAPLQSVLQILLRRPRPQRPPCPAAVGVSFTSV